MRTQTSVDNTVHDLCYEIKPENCVKDKNNFFIKQNINYLSISFVKVNTKKHIYA